MNRLLILLPLSLAAASPALAAREAVGVYGLWGAFRDGGRCYAVAEPDAQGRSAEARPFAAVSWTPAARVRGQLNIRFPRLKRPGSAVLLRIDERTFQLIGGGADAWAPDAGADAQIVAAMRTGVSMSVETRAATGALMRETYSLRGAASAIDAAAIACARR